MKSYAVTLFGWRRDGRSPGLRLSPSRSRERIAGRPPDSRLSPEHRRTGLAPLPSPLLSHALGLALPSPLLVSTGD